jgi:uncharacterized protein YjbK
MIHLEIEYKTLLNKDEFNRLTTLLSHIKPVTQTNYYFDTETFDMKAHRMSLRIRTYCDRAELTLKIPKDIGNMEHNHDLTLSEAKNIIKTGQLPDIPLIALIRENGVEPKSLKTFGNLTTTRRETLTDIGLMALDHNQYADIIDYELELEVTDPEEGKRNFDKFLRKHHINFKYAKSKVARFSSTLKKK